MVLYDESFRRLVASNIRAGMTTAEIVDGLHCNERLVRRYRVNIRAFDTHSPAPSSINHRPRSIHPAAAEGLRDLLNGSGTIMLDEMFTVHN